LEGAPPITKIDGVPLRVHSDRSVPVADRQEFDSAFGCNGNGICHHWGEAEVMCPSYKVTLDPRLSPKGRADLLRGWLANPDDSDLAEDVADSMRQCLSCGACTGRCPVEVDIPELKSRFLERHPEGSRRLRVRDALLSRFESLLPRVQAGARVVGPLQRLTVPIFEKGLGIIDLPRVPTGSLRTRLAALDVPDVFTAYLDPDVLDATMRVLRAVGERPALAPFLPSGKFDHVKGRRRRFAKAAAQQRDLIERLARHDLPLVIIEPAVALLGAHEYVSIDASFPSDATTSLAEFVAPRLAALPASTGRGNEGAVQLFGHCTEVSLAPERMGTYRSMLEAAGFDVQTEATTCCGMAGIFGHEAESQPMSTALFNMGWRQKLESGDPVHRCASGYSCRSQAKRFGHTLTHPIQVLASAIS
jgi:Fe-S oxidoreductase